jgi:hypothetical protein
MEYYLYRDGENVNRGFGLGCEKEGVNDAKESGLIMLCYFL